MMSLAFVMSRLSHSPIGSPAIQRLGHLVLALAVLTAFSLNVFRALDLDVFLNPPVWGVLHSVPAALSNIFVDSVPRYTYSTQIFNAYFVTPWVLPDSSIAVNEAIARISNMDFKHIGSDYLLLGNDDKGIVDLVEISFRLFGLRLESVTIAYYLLLGLSTLLFVTQYWSKPTAMVAAVCLLYSMYQLMPFIVFNVQLVSPLAMRVMPMLSTIACLHCVLWYFYPRTSISSIAALLLQVLLIVFVLHIRSTTMWQVQLICLGGILAAAIAWRSTFTPFRRGGRWMLPILLLPTVASIVGVTFLNSYREFAYPIEYTRGEQILTRVMWHNIYSGFALHPTIAKDESLRIDDMSVFAATGVYLKRTDQELLWKDIGGETNFTGIKWAKYDSVVREMLISTCSDRVLQCLETFLRYKPYYYLDTLMWFYTVRSIPKVSGFFVSNYFGDIVKQQIIATGNELKRRKWTGAPWRSGFVLLLATLAAAMVACGKRFDSRGLISLAATALFSLAPAFVGYPSPHGMVDSVVIVSSLVQVLLVTLSVFLWRLVQTHLGARKHH